jgi:hypothetical protein
MTIVTLNRKFKTNEEKVLNQKMKTQDNIPKPIEMPVDDGGDIIEDDNDSYTSKRSPVQAELKLF